MMIATGKLVEVLIFVTVAAISLYVMVRRKNAKFRRLPAVDAMDDMIDRCVEVGRPYYFSPGDQVLSGVNAPMTIAGLDVLRYLARKCFGKGVTILSKTSEATLVPVMDGIIREAAIAAGKPEKYDRDQLRYLIAGTASVIADMRRQRIGCYTAVGGFGGAQAFQELEEAHRSGAVVIGGTARYYHNGNFAIFADYPMFMEDIYAVAADVTGDPKVQNTLLSEEFIKLFIIAVLFIFSILGALGLPVLKWLSL